MLRAELRALRNLLRTREGRQVLIGHLIVLACLVAGSMALSSRTLLGEDVLKTVRSDASGDLQRVFYGLILLLPLILLLGVGSTQLTGELFVAPRNRLLLSAPISSFALLRCSWMRSLATWTLVGWAMAAPPVLGLSTESGGSRLALLVLPLALALLVAPIVALQVLLKVVFVRWCSRPALRRALMAIQLGFCFVLALLLLMGVLRGDDVQRASMDWLAQQRDLPTWLDTPAALLAWSAGVPRSAARLAPTLLLLAAPWPVLGLAAANYRRAYELHLISRDRASHAARRRPWPASVERSFLRKGLLETVRLRSNLVFYAFLMVLVLIGLERGFDREAKEYEQLFPLVLHQSFEILRAWYGLSLLVACLAFLGMVGDEQRQISLLATAPFERRRLLHAKLLVVASPFVLSASLAAIGAPLIGGASWSSAGLFVLAALPLTAFFLGLLAAVGTWPWAVKLHSDVPLASNLRSVGPVLVIALVASPILFAMTKLRFALSSSYYGHGALKGWDGVQAAWLGLGVTWIAGGIALWIGTRLGRANLTRLLGPQT